MAAARALSLVFQPGVALTALLFALAVGHPSWRGPILALWLLLAGLPAAVLALGLRLGVWSDIEIPRLNERRTYLPVCTLLAGVALVWASVGPFPDALRLTALAIALWLAVSTLTSFAWKISLHEGAAVGVVLLAGRLFGVPIAVAFAWAPFAVAWARLRLGRHTPAQLAAGAAAAAGAFALAVVMIGPPG